MVLSVTVYLNSVTLQDLVLEIALCCVPGVLDFCKVLLCVCMCVSVSVSVSGGGGNMC